MSDVSMIGARGPVTDPVGLLRRLLDLLPGRVLLLDADMVCGKEHIDAAVAHARRAFQYGSNDSEDMAMEVMLYASGERQLAKARSKMGVKEGEARVAIVLLDGELPPGVCERLGLVRDDDVLAFSRQKAERLGVASMELDLVPDDLAIGLVLERVAFVDVLKR
ncbi:MAG TPA: KEOPS complex subunit Cgi121 [Methanomassiliicoccales archaeon]|nr:KEOPS complex subunit Cgi121 [Methanomassiliicoccales archaeon]